MYEGHGGTPFPHGLHTFHMQYVNWLFQIDGVPPMFIHYKKCMKGRGGVQNPWGGWSCIYYIHDIHGTHYIHTLHCIALHTCHKYLHHTTYMYLYIAFHKYVQIHTHIHTWINKDLPIYLPTYIYTYIDIGTYTYTLKVKDRTTPQVNFFQ